MINRTSIITRLLRFLKKRFFYYRYHYFFGFLDKKCEIQKPYLIDGTRYIFIGKNTFIAEGAWISAFKCALIKKVHTPKISIGENVYIGRFSHIIAIDELTIADSVLIADKVYISDNKHQFDCNTTPIKNQEIKFIKKVTINEGAWIGENACIIGASIGKNSVVAANSVVVSDVPDYTVVAGIPAKIIKVFNSKTQKWEKIVKNDHNHA
ncbi:DapH/DapD/GlmU-related protein [Proteus faecis]|uniref:DapH/DapD/GlmU-related protein n=1 Tax=Proteus faecis TaxID=2050967 RepID=UPI003075E6AB